MDAETQLQEACDQWTQLARAEGEAIRARDWTRLGACQEALQQLQQQMTPCLQRVRQAWAELGLDRACREQALQARVGELIALEQQNEALLQDARRAVQVRLSQSQQTARTLHRLRSSYAPVPAAAWTSYS